MTTASYAHGWYLVAFSKELGPVEVKPVRYFGQEFVLYRTEGGEPVLMEAFCPHLGAHLGHGGRVEGDAIRCPFHAWKFDKGGRCTEVPYAKRIPPRAEVKARTLREQDGLILGYFGAEGAAPDYEIPRLPQLSDPAWSDLATDQAVIKTEAREVIENIADRAHFLPVHATKVDEFEVIIDGPRATQRTIGKGRNLRGEKIDVLSVATYHGPAIQFTDLAWAYPMVLINAHIPIDSNRLLLRFGVAVKTGVGVVLPPEIMSAVVAAARDGYFQDVAIWENKKWRDTPVLADGDGPIGRIRDWYKGFFAEASA